MSILHCPPIAFGINRTTWTQKLLGKVMTEKGYRAGNTIVASIIKSAGYKFRKAREVLTSNDPLYRTKLKKITGILSHLGPRDRFFSIDEFGPFAVKQKGGRRWVPPGEYPSFPQWQRSKGCLIMHGGTRTLNKPSHLFLLYKKRLHRDDKTAGASCYTVSGIPTNLSLMGRSFLACF